MSQSQHFTVIAVGTGFATSFFLHRYLESAPPDARVLVLERGPRLTTQELIDQLPHEPLDGNPLIRRAGRSWKTWKFSVGFGGGSNCWWACTPRFMPADFQMQSRYGVGEDWPITYDDLEPFYADAEDIMTISGPDVTPYPRSGPYPQPGHEFSDVDRVLQAAFGEDLYIVQPTARSRLGTQNRAPCCANGVCSLCPANAKFTIENEMGHLYDDPRVTLLTGAEVLRVETAGNVATGVTYRTVEGDVSAKGDLVCLGANAIFNPAILLASGINDDPVGRYLNEQSGIEATAYLDGVKNFAGSTVVTGHGFMFYDGPHRAERSGCLVEVWNRGEPRFDYGRWAETVRVRLIFEDLPQYENRVMLADDGDERPIVNYDHRSTYLEDGLKTAKEHFDRLLAPLPLERYEMLGATTDEAHILGSARMGSDPSSSVVDADLRHHRYRNLLVLGASSFVTGPPANPTLTLSALSLRAADRLMSGSS